MAWERKCFALIYSAPLLTCFIERRGQYFRVLRSRSAFATAASMICWYKTYFRERLTISLQSLAQSAGLGGPHAFACKCECFLYISKLTVNPLVNMKRPIIEHCSLSDLCLIYTNVGYPPLYLSLLRCTCIIVCPKQIKLRQRTMSNSVGLIQWTQPVVVDCHPLMSAWAADVPQHCDSAHAVSVFHL